jgi:hypothetical protein
MNNNMKRRLIIIALSILAISLTACTIKLPGRDQDSSIVVDNKSKLAASCQEDKGSWIEAYQECENISQEWCDSKRGHFDSCASACRHDNKDGEPSMCTMQCVFVCSFIKPEAPAPFINNPENASYIIDGQEVSLVNGEGSASSSPSSFKVFGEPAYNDIDGNGTDDSVMFISEATASSTKYHLVASLLGEDGLYSDTNSLLLGDKILPKTLNISGKIITAEYVLLEDGRDSDKALSKKAAFKSGQLVFVK